MIRYLFNLKTPSFNSIFFLIVWSYRKIHKLKNTLKIIAQLNMKAVIRIILLCGSNYVFKNKQSSPAGRQFVVNIVKVSS